MTTPNFLSDSVHNPGDYTEAIAADVAGILTTVKDKLVTNGNWTLVSESAGSNILIQSPTNPSGLWFDVLLTRIDADTLECRVRNHLGTSLFNGSRRIDIESSGNTTVNYYWGDDYLFIVSRRSTAEIFCAGLLDPEPDIPGSITNALVGFCYRNSAGSTGSFQVDHWFAIDNVTGSGTNRGKQPNATSSLGSIPLITATGRLLYSPLEIVINQGGTNRNSGQFPMLLYCDSSLAFDTLKKPGIDSSTGKVYIVLPWTTANSTRLMIRKPSADL